MAKYKVVFSCGHWEFMEIYRDHLICEYIVAMKKHELCPKCLQIQRAQATKQAQQEALKLGLPELEGSKKQIQWAEQIRRSVFLKFDENLENTTIYEFLAEQDQASWWIDNRKIQYKNLDEIKKYFSKKIDKNKENELQEKLIAEQEQKEILLLKDAEIASALYPENFRTNQITEINIEGQVIKVSHPRYDKYVAKTLRELNLKWDGTKFWQREIIEINGNIEDRVIEIAYNLLSEGFPVSIHDQKLREKAAKGAYKQEHHNWIVVLQNYPDMFSIMYKNNEYYAETRLISGRKYLNKKVLIPLDSIDELLDFANMYGFKFSAAAEQLVKKAEELKRKKIFVKVEKSNKETKEKGSTTPVKLEIPENIEIDDEFKD